MTAHPRPGPPGPASPEPPEAQPPWPLAADDARVLPLSLSERNQELFGRLHGPAHQEVRAELVRLHLPLVEHCARRFRHRGEPLEDLVQVGTIGLIKAVDRFDPGRDTEFSTYATPTVLGEIKRHFRDKGWAVRVPRRLQELRLQLVTTTAELNQGLGRSPTARELADAMGCSVEEVVEALESSNAYTALSLDAGDEAPDGALALLDTLGHDDVGIAHVEVRESVRSMLGRLPEREKRILLLRFYDGLTQSQIAEELGVSQVHVSRLLSQTLTKLRSRLEGPAAGR